MNFKYRFLFFIIFSLCLLFIKGSNEPSNIQIDETVFEGIVNSRQIRNYELEMVNLKNTTDLTYLVYYYRKSSDNSKFGGYYLKRIDHKLNYLSMILLVDCDQVIPRNISHCQIKREDVDQFPIIKLLVPPIQKFDAKTKKMNIHQEINFSEENVSEETLFKFITRSIPSFSTRLNREHIEHFLGQPMFNKIILFTDKPKTPLTYRGLSNLYYDRILLGEIHKEDKEFIERFNITSFPTIVAIQNPFLLKDTYSIHYYNGTNNADQISEFIDQFALREKNYVKRLEENKIEKNPFRSINTENFDEFFDIKNKTKIVYFVNNNSKDSVKIPEDLKKFAQLTSGYFLFAIFNCRNFKQFCKSEFFVDVDVLPSLYLFNNTAYPDYKEMMKKNRLLPISFMKLQTYFTDRIKSNILKVKVEEIYDQISVDRQNERYPIVYIHKNETKVNLPLHLMSSLNIYSNKISFYELNNPSEELLEIFKINYKEPLTILFIHDKTSDDSFRLIRLEDAHKNIFLNLKNFIEQVIGDYMYPIIPNDYKERKHFHSTIKFEPLEDRLQFYRKCIYDQKYCVFAMLDGDYNSELKRINLNFKRNLNKIESLPQENDLSNYIGHFYYVNATCFDEFSAAVKVRVSQMPTVVIYDPFNKMYAKMKADEPFEKEKIANFLREAIERKVFYRKLENIDEIFQDKYCQGKMTKSKDIDFERLDRINSGMEDDDQEEEENIKNEL